MKLVVFGSGGVWAAVFAATLPSVAAAAFAPRVPSSLLDRRGFSRAVLRSMYDDNDSTSDSSDEQFSAPMPSTSDAAASSADGASQAERTETVNALLRIAAGTDRGTAATLAQREEASSCIETLESMSPITNPTNSPSVVGTWELLYSTTQLFRSSPFFMAGRAVCKDGEEAERYDWFCDMHRAALAVSTVGQVRQIIGPTRMTSEFEVKVGAVPFLSDFTPFQYSGGWPVTIDGAIVSTADITPTSFGDGWEIFMDTVEIKGSNVPLLRQILDSGLKLASRDLGSFLESNVSGYSNPKPIFETTYLDESLRISRDQDGKVFVYGKVSDSYEPTDYENVMPDLGFGKLLEGFNDSVTKFYI